MSNHVGLALKNCGDFRIFFHEYLAFFSPKGALGYGEKWRFIEPCPAPFLKIRTNLN